MSEARNSFRGFESHTLRHIMGTDWMNEELIAEVDAISSTWTRHKDYVDWVLQFYNGAVVVDLGVDFGYSTFCMANANPKNLVFGVDSFEGDEHSGFRNTYQHCNDYQYKMGLKNLHFLKGYFDDVASRWEDMPIDVLHIDGLHTYEAVKNDYETWSKFMRPNHIIMFHDTYVWKKDFGVRKFFIELNKHKVNFNVSNGLGVISDNPEIIAESARVFRDRVEFVSFVGG